MGHKVKWCLRLLSRKNTRPDVETVKIVSVCRAELTTFPKSVVRQHLILWKSFVMSRGSIAMLSES